MLNLRLKFRISTRIRIPCTNNTISLIRTDCNIMFYNKSMLCSVMFYNKSDLDFHQMLMDLSITRPLLIHMLFVQLHLRVFTLNAYLVNPISQRQNAIFSTEIKYHYLKLPSCKNNVNGIFLCNC